MRRMGEEDGEGEEEVWSLMVRAGLGEKAKVKALAG